MDELFTAALVVYRCARLLGTTERDIYHYRRPEGRLTAKGATGRQRRAALRVALAVTRDLTSFSLPELGLIFSKHHTTVVYHLEQARHTLADLIAYVKGDLHCDFTLATNAEANAQLLMIAITQRYEASRARKRGHQFALLSLRRKVLEQRPTRVGRSLEPLVSIPDDIWREPELTLHMSGSPTPAIGTTTQTPTQQTRT